MLVGKVGEAVDCVRTLILVEVLKLSRSQVPVGVVGDAGKVVCPYVCNTPDDLHSNLDVVGVDQEKEFSELAHHRRGLRCEMCKDADDRRVIFVKKKTTTLELGEERMDRASHSLQLLEGYVLLDIHRRSKPSGLDEVI